jgi:hypothetical protein
VREVNVSSANLPRFCFQFSSFRFAPMARPARTPPFNFHHLPQTDGIIRGSTAPIPAETKKFNGHFRGFRSIAVAKLNDIIGPAFQPAAPMRRLIAILDALRPGDDGGEVFAVEVEMKDAGGNHVALYRR